VAALTACAGGDVSQLTLRPVPDPDDHLRHAGRGAHFRALGRPVPRKLTCSQRLERAQIASLALLADDMIDADLEAELLENAGV
jgi:hypothetical protein